MKTTASESVPNSQFQLGSEVGSRFRSYPLPTLPQFRRSPPTTSLPPPLSPPTTRADLSILRRRDSDLGGGWFVDPSALARAMAAMDSGPAVATSTCEHCQREIPSSNVALHSAHCARNLKKCQHCGDMVPRKLMDEHYDENHAPMNCSLCRRSIERELWDLHTGIQCPQRMLACQYCEFELPAVDLLEHQDVCGNRTEYCQECRKYIRLREWIGHGIQFHANSSAEAELSSGTTMEKEERATTPGQPLHPAAHGSKHKQLLMTIAIAGIAVLIGSILYHKRG